MIHKLFVKDKKFYKLALTLALPIVLQNMITIGVNIIDTVMLGSYGEVQLSGSSLANEFINIFHILCMGMGGGAAVLTAQFWALWSFLLSPCRIRIGRKAGKKTIRPRKSARP